MREFQWRTLSSAVVVIGVVSGLIGSLTLTSAEVDAGRRSAVLIMNVVYWGTWAVLIPAAVFLALRIRARGWPWPAALAAHVCGCSPGHDPSGRTVLVEPAADLGDDGVSDYVEAFQPPHREYSKARG